MPVAEQFSSFPDPFHAGEVLQRVKTFEEGRVMDVLPDGGRLVLVRDSGRLEYYDEHPVSQGKRIRRETESFDLGASISVCHLVSQGILLAGPLLTPRLFHLGNITEVSQRLIPYPLCVWTPQNELAQALFGCAMGYVTNLQGRTVLRNASPGKSVKFVGKLVSEFSSEIIVIFSDGEAWFVDDEMKRTCSINVPGPVEKVVSFKQESHLLYCTPFGLLYEIAKNLQGNCKRIDVSYGRVQDIQRLDDDNAFLLLSTGMWRDFKLPDMSSPDNTTDITGVISRLRELEQTDVKLAQDESNMHNRIECIMFLLNLEPDTFSPGFNIVGGSPLRLQLVREIPSDCGLLVTVWRHPRMLSYFKRDKNVCIDLLPEQSLVPILVDVYLCFESITRKVGEIRIDLLDPIYPVCLDSSAGGSQMNFVAFRAARSSLTKQFSSAQELADICFVSCFLPETHRLAFPSKLRCVAHIDKHIRVQVEIDGPEIVARVTCNTVQEASALRESLHHRFTPFMKPRDVQEHNPPLGLVAQRTLRQVRESLEHITGDREAQHLVAAAAQTKLLDIWKEKCEVE